MVRCLLGHKVSAISINVWSHCSPPDQAILEAAKETSTLVVPIPTAEASPNTPKNINVEAVVGMITTKISRMETVMDKNGQVMVVDTDNRSMALGTTN
jgi:uncharacterized protein (DUF4213/DUF364 family)